MSPVLAAAALVVGCCGLWLAGFFALEGGIREAAPVWVPFALIGAAVLLTTGAGIVGAL